PVACSAATCGARPAPSGAGARTPAAARCVGVAPWRASALITLSCVAFSVLTRRSTGGRAARPAHSCGGGAADPAPLLGRAGAEGTLERRQQPFRNIASDVRRRGIGKGSGETGLFG